MQIRFICNTQAAQNALETTRHQRRRSLQKNRFACVGWRALQLVLVLCLVLGQTALSQVNILTGRVDSGRTGQNPNETYLNPSNVNSNLFGKLFTYNVDGFVTAQPLYVSNVAIPGQGTHNVVYVVTQHDSVYAFDADSPGSLLLWYDSFVDASQGVTSVPISVQGCQKITKFNEIGIMGTPVIDPTTRTMYLDAKTMEVSGSTTSYVHRLHAIDITTGAEKFGGPVVITASVPGTYGTFDTTSKTLDQLQRPGLLLANGNVYLGFGSNGCDRNARGWLMAYNASNIQQQVAVFNTEPNQPFGASIWMGGSGLAVDANGSVYLSTANGIYDINTGGSDWGDTVMRFTQGSSSLSVADYFTPDDEVFLSSHDEDLGSGGVTLLPDPSPGPNPHLMITAGKEGTIYLINRDNMGGYSSTSNNNLQTIPSAMGELDGNPIVWNSGDLGEVVYFAPQTDSIKAFSLGSNGLLSTVPIMETNPVQPAGTPAISANGNTNGVLWIVLGGTPTSALFSAYDANTLGLLYNSNQAAGSRDSLGPIAHFANPTIANGRVYVGTQSQLVTYGLFPELLASAGNNQSGTVSTTLPAPLTIQGTDPYSGNPLSGVAVSCSDGGKGGVLNPASGSTNSSGVFTTTYTLPTLAATYTISCTSSGYSTAKFTVTANAGSPVSLAVVSGGNQSGTVGTVLPAPLVVKAKDTYGNGVPNIQINFSDGGAGGGFSSNPVTTDSTGKASVSYTLPKTVGTKTVTASYNTLTANFKEVAKAGTPATLGIVSGNNQTGAPNHQLPKPLVVVVQDAYGNGVSGITVTFSDSGSGGSFSTTTPSTNAAGQASVTYTTPSTPGLVNITASVTGLTSVVFTETVT